MAVTGAPGGIVAVDDAADACDGRPDTRILNQDGAVGPVPFDVDVNQFPSGDSWVCVSANGNSLAKRILIDGTAVSVASFASDTSTPYPLNAERAPTGSASSACQNASSGKTRVVNADVGPTHVWLYTWTESSTRTHACVRVDGSLGAEGGRLTVDGNNGPTFANVDSSADFSPCETNVLTLGTPPIAVKTHSGATPAWVCLRADSTYRRVKIDAGNGQSVVSFTPDT
ncbi:MAG: hypothetical protein QOE65_289 [Solirubrobacteraceae bacterium]|nr:hypothetical protein [Solirubrobacteraceae bacterium]